jgi:paraquat-inducible protein A
MLSASHTNANDRVIAFALTALVFLMLSFQFDFLTFSAQGQDRVVTLLESITVLSSDHFISLAILIFLSIIVIPALCLLSIVYVFISIRKERLFPYTKQQLKFIGHLEHWNMAEIFLIGILVSFIKITSLADVTLGLSFWCYVLFIISMTSSLLNLDKHQVWQTIKNKTNNSPAPLKTVGKDDYLACHVCTSVTLNSDNICKDCGSELHNRNKNSIQRTWALLVTSVVLYVPANILPIMHTNFLGEHTANTILGGVVVLWNHGSYPIALIIFIASVFVPIAKIIVLGWLSYSIQTRNEKSFKQKTKLYRITELVGRWSMVDVFVVAVLVALIKLGNIMSIYPGLGAVAFAGMVIVTILAAISFDPRLIWDPINMRNDK